jgi:hypothetical protein
MPAKIKVEYCCGCGYKTENELEAVLHSEKKNHSLFITGTITKADKPKVEPVA